MLALLTHNDEQKFLSLIVDRISFRTVSPAYTSQKCSSCGFTSKKNRNGEVFRCQECESTGNADINAARNILFRFISGTYGSRYKPLRLDVGFV